MGVDDGDGDAGAVSGARLVAAGTRLADRYRLSERVGVDESGSVEFWLAHDGVLARQVGATLVARSDEAEHSLWTAALVTALLRWGQFSYPGCPRILDVVGVGQGPELRGLPERIGVAVVTDWAAGPDLLAFLGEGRADTGSGDLRAGGAGDGQGRAGWAGRMRPATALGMVAPLAAAAEAAHARDLLLGCDRPEVLYIAQAGTRTAHVHLGFLLPDPSRGPGDDVRGLGAMLYALLTGRWPAEGAAAARVSGGAAVGASSPVPPQVVEPEVPRVVSELTMAALGLAPSGAPSLTAAGLRQGIADLLVDASRGTGLGYGTEVEPVAPVLGSGRGSTDPGSGALERPGPGPGVPRWARRVPRRAVSAAGVLVLVAVLAVTGLTVWHQSRPGHGVLAPRSATAAAPGAGVNTLSGAAQVVSASVYDPTGQPDNPSQVWRALGTDPKAGWSTDTYLQPFPALKPGVGIMVGFTGPVQLTSLTVTSPSTGSVVQVRAAPDPTSALNETTLMASTTLQAGETVVSLADSLPVTHVLVWITTLGGGGDDNVTEISNLRFERATD